MCDLRKRLLILLLFTFLLLAAAPDARADGLTVYLTKDGQTVTGADYGPDQLAALGMETYSYSSVDATGAPVGIIAQGIGVGTLLADLGLGADDVESLRFSASDGWVRSYSLDSYSYGRYFFPRIVECWDVEAAAQPAFLPGAEDGAVSVPPLLAVCYYEERDNAYPAADYMSSSGCLRFCYGQTTVTEAAHLNYGKNITSVEVIIRSGSSFVLPGGSDPAPADEPVNPAVPDTGIPEVLDREGLMADDLTVTVGYWGGEYYTKAVFTYEELAAMADVQQIYSIIDNMPAVCLDAAIGVRLTDILEAAGIDVNSVQSFNFYCADVARTWYTTYNKSYLLDTPRFYYPSLAENWNREEAVALPGATAGAVPVPAILAIQDKWRRFATKTDFTDLTDTTRYRLIFGQTDVSTIEGSRSAKWVHTLAVTLGGTPPKGVFLDEDGLRLKVGSTYRLSARVEAGDETTDTRVTWSSSDESVATVDANGKLTVVGEGEAVITVTTLSGQLTDSVTVNATGGDNEEKAEEKEQIAGDTQNDAEETEGVNVTGPVYKVLLGGQATTAPEESAVQNWRTEDMSDDAVPLAQAEPDPAVRRTTQILLSSLFIAGVIGRYLIYLLEV